jgi:predicted nuclease of predicted toxin-antitoxin system
MRLLLDQNLSFRLASAISALFPDTVHVRDFGLANEDDEGIWAFAARHQCVIVSKDADFAHRALLLGQPPKVIHLRVGNASTEEIQRLIELRKDTIRRFLQDPVESLLSLG